MTEPATLEAVFRSVLDHAEGAPSAEPVAAPTEAFGNAVAATILPRTVTLSAGEARLSVIARNRRIVSIADVRPAGLWTEDDPADAGSEGFAAPFAACLISVADAGDATVETALVDGPVPGSTLAGYPATRLAQDVAAARDDGDADGLSAFLDACAAHPRAWAGTETGVEIPDGAPVDAAWIEARLAEWTASGPETGIRLIATGDGPVAALALVARGGDRCAVACTDAAEIAALQAALNDIREEG